MLEYEPTRILLSPYTTLKTTTKQSSYARSLTIRFNDLTDQQFKTCRYIKNKLWLCREWERWCNKHSNWFLLGRTHHRLCLPCWSIKLWGRAAVTFPLHAYNLMDRLLKPPIVCLVNVREAGWKKTRGIDCKCIIAWKTERDCKGQVW